MSELFVLWLFGFTAGAVAVGWWREGYYRRQLRRLSDEAWRTPAGGERLFTIGYVPSNDGPTGEFITCHLCSRTSHNWNDVRNRYCGHCHVYFDEKLLERERSVVE